LLHGGGIIVVLVVNDPLVVVTVDSEDGVVGTSIVVVGLGSAFVVVEAGDAALEDDGLVTITVGPDGDVDVVGSAVEETGDSELPGDCAVVVVCPPLDDEDDGGVDGFPPSVGVPPGVEEISPWVGGTLEDGGFPGEVVVTIGVLGWPVVSPGVGETVDVVIGGWTVGVVVVTGGGTVAVVVVEAIVVEVIVVVEAVVPGVVVVEVVVGTFPLRSAFWQKSP
jgi:hypothetical protein